jgi:sporulation protein YlmC with PRC-barrel domain
MARARAGRRAGALVAAASLSRRTAMNKTKAALISLGSRIAGMNRLKAIALAALLCSPFAIGPAVADAPVAGKAMLGMTVAEAELIANGWRVSKLLHADVRNDKGEKIGKIDDIVVAPDGTLSLAVIDVGGFLGIGAHRVAIPVHEMQVAQNGARITLPGANKDALKALPDFKYTS